MDHESRLSRRRFLQTSATFAGAMIVPVPKVHGVPCKLTMPPGVPRSRVVQFHSRKLVDGSRVHPHLLKEAFARVLDAVTRSDATAGAGWRALLSPTDTIGLKFNRSAQSILGTTPAMAATIIDSLLSAGFSSKQIVCIEAPMQDLAQYDLLKPKAGFSDTVLNFGSGRDQFIAALDQVTALINVPFLKTHNIAGITCALKNLSHGLVKHPARYHANGCSPYIADIVGLDAIRAKLRLTVVDGLRVVFDGGPSASIETIEDAGILFASTDPVAADLTGLNAINEIRQQRGFSGIATNGVCLPYLADAHKKGLGIAVPFGIETVALSA